MSPKLFKLSFEAFEIGIWLSISKWNEDENGALLEAQIRRSYPLSRNTTLGRQSKIGTHFPFGLNRYAKTALLSRKTNSANYTTPQTTQTHTPVNENSIMQQPLKMQLCSNEYNKNPITESAYKHHQLILNKKEDLQWKVLPATKSSRWWITRKKKLKQSKNI